ncbi:MAG: glycosyltransferase family 9 protein, partial [Patescibacteria group bacterium]
MIVNRFKNLFFWIGAIAFLPLFNFYARKKIKSKELRILIIPHMTRVGDLIATTPAIRAIKQKYPQSFVAVAVGKKIAPILENNPYVDAVVVYRANNLLGFLRKVFKRNFNWSFNFSGTSFGTLISLYGAIPNKVKLEKEEKYFNEVLTDKLNNHRFLYKNHTDPILHFLSMLKILGIESTDTKKNIFIYEIGEAKASKFGGSMVGISVSAGNRAKEWGDEKFKELAVRINEKYGTKIVFIGAQSDEARILRIVDGLDKEKFLAATDFSLGELPSLIKKLKLYIAVDTGPIHIADALLVPFIDIVGPVDPAELPPKRE